MPAGIVDHRHDDRQARRLQHGVRWLVQHVYGWNDQRQTLQSATRSDLRPHSWIGNGRLYIMRIKDGWYMRAWSDMWVHSGCGDSGLYMQGQAVCLSEENLRADSKPDGSFVGTCVWPPRRARPNCVRQTANAGCPKWPFSKGSGHHPRPSRLRHIDPGSEVATSSLLATDRESLVGRVRSRRVWLRPKRCLVCTLRAPLDRRGGRHLRHHAGGVCFQWSINGGHESG